MDDCITQPALTTAAPAKINLALHITGQRDDGYHLLDTLAVRTVLADTLTVKTARRDQFEINGPLAAALADTLTGDNLVLQARDALRAHLGMAAQPVALHLEKHLPVAAGIGGGSANAAATLDALNTFWRTSLDDAALAHLATHLGADVPMCRQHTPVRARGVGELLSPVAAIPSMPILLVNPGVMVSTAQVFRRLENRTNDPIDFPDGWRDGAMFIDWLRHETRNDLHYPAAQLCPPINDTLLALRACGADIARMSGSGATCFGIFRSDVDAARAAQTLVRQKPDWFVVATETLPSPDMEITQ